MVFDDIQRESWAIVVIAYSKLLNVIDVIAQNAYCPALGFCYPSKPISLILVLEIWRHAANVCNAAISGISRINRQIPTQVPAMRCRAAIRLHDVQFEKLPGFIYE